MFVGAKIDMSSGDDDCADSNVKGENEQENCPLVCFTAAHQRCGSAQLDEIDLPELFT